MAEWSNSKHDVKSAKGLLNCDSFLSPLLHAHTQGVKCLQDMDGVELPAPK
jgi:hypothetical protein